ncbi:MAG: 3-deoxy-D-manno-octulosonic acid transferase, partial [Proteobacteria bacterium]|nr:3-deoxy-D-manno-octulosonic acid transferase [Pseudomonadota bacterium]
LWIQAASVGEAYLAIELIKNLKPEFPTRVLITTNTKQGLEILERSIIDILKERKEISISVAYFPFDKPSIMKKAVKQVRPKIMILLESELWPGLLYSLKQYGCTIIIINGRITEKSLKRYLVWPSLWYSLRPDKIFAISEKDADRFAKLFGPNNVNVMPNIKFDRIGYNDSMSPKSGPIEKIIAPDTDLIILGSVRREEETAVEKIIIEILKRRPDIVIGLFPKHLQRIKFWENALNRLKIPFILRSNAETHVTPGTIILWDTFGELNFAYSHSKAAFVGGSLAPLGGQNFLEALTSGVIPVIGPSWENFYWVGNEIVKQGLVRIAQDWKQVADTLIEDVKKHSLHEDVRKKALLYLKSHQGGTAQLCSIIKEILNIKYKGLA